MARGRMIAATVADDKRFNELPIDAALVYLMTIPQLDRDGLILGEPTVLWGQVCRRRVELLPNMPAIIGVWLKSGLVGAFQTDDGDTVLHFVGFQKNQAMTHYDREAPSRFPCPPGYARTDKGLVLDKLQTNEKPTANKVRSESGVSPDEVLPNVMQCNVNKSKENGIEPQEAGGQAEPFGMPDPRRAPMASEHTKAAKAEGVNAETFRLITDALIDACGWRAMVDAGNGRKLLEAKDAALELVRMGHKTVEHAMALTAAFEAANTWRKSPPKPDDFVTYASQVKAGVTVRVNTNGHVNGTSKVAQSLAAVDRVFDMLEGEGA